MLRSEWPGRHTVRVMYSTAVMNSVNPPSTVALLTAVGANCSRGLLGTCASGAVRHPSLLFYASTSQYQIGKKLARFIPHFVMEANHGGLVASSFISPLATWELNQNCAPTPRMEVAFSILQGHVHVQPTAAHKTKRLWQMVRPCCEEELGISDCPF